MHNAHVQCGTLLKGEHEPRESANPLLPSPYLASAQSPGLATFDLSFDLAIDFDLSILRFNSL